MTIKTQRLIERAKKLTKKGDFEEAKKLYTSVLDESPNNQEVKTALLYLEQGKTDLRAPKLELQSVIALYSNGQIQEALDKIEVLVKDFPRAGQC